ncbi:O-methyltransferase [Halothermothrix orenii]|uniref:tRNA 5-hydroxyuridine methyltransferase n=1 Tax=Halothermothrix orenii (strain H 168 / OCM 544 / DSM 9562) TaxID=373903 RepID=B8D2B3_HALOH|nr:O-methyltransferase [Halothermothrix orenii]ACL69340.1 O-methyltransferase family 3 [Halothermothrix orenii H 168]
MNDDRSISFVKTTELLKNIEEEARRRYIPVVRPEVGQFLMILTRLVNPVRILEIGTAIGYSTIWMARGSSPGTEIVTIEKNEESAFEALENFKKAGIEDRINIKIGDALEIIPFLRRQFDLVFIDGAKGQYINYFDLVIDLLPIGGVIVADNVLYRGKVKKGGYIKHKHRTMVRNLRNYLDKINNHKLFDSTVIPVGDGISLSVRRKNSEKS